MSEYLSKYVVIIRRFLVHSDTEYRPFKSPVSHLCRVNRIVAWQSTNWLAAKAQFSPNDIHEKSNPNPRKRLGYHYEARVRCACSQYTLVFCWIIKVNSELFEEAHTIDYGSLALLSPTSSSDRHVRQHPCFTSLFALQVKRNLHQYSSYV